MVEAYLIQSDIRKYYVDDAYAYARLSFNMVVMREALREGLHEDWSMF